MSRVRDPSRTLALVMCRGPRYGGRGTPPGPLISTKCRWCCRVSASRTTFLPEWTLALHLARQPHFHRGGGIFFPFEIDMRPICVIRNTDLVTMLTKAKNTNSLPVRFTIIMSHSHTVVSCPLHTSYSHCCFEGKSFASFPRGTACSSASVFDAVCATTALPSCPFSPGTFPIGTIASLCCFPHIFRVNIYIFIYIY